MVFLYVSVYSPVQNLRIIDDLPTPPFPTTITLMVAADGPAERPGMSVACADVWMSVCVRM
jgi:hypothetical protein